MIRKMECSFYGDNSQLLCVKNIEQYFIHNSKTYANDRNISAWLR